MNRDDYEIIMNISRRRIQEVSMDLRRFLMDHIDWRDRLIAIIGTRGTGKTTMILQHIKECFPDDLDDALYVSLDLPGLSFREYLYFEGIGNFDPVSLSELLSGHIQYASIICENRKISF